MAFAGVLFAVTLAQGQLASANLLGAAAPARPLVASAWAHTRDVRRSLDEVLDAALSKDEHKITDVHVDRLKSSLRPLFDALPKNGKGLLGHAAVRYALHRHFVHQHGMYVKGFEPAGEAWNSSSPIDVLEDRVPGYVQHLFEERLHDGFDLQELALLAAALEHFVHQESAQRLKAVYRLTGHSEQEEVSSTELQAIMDGYMALHLYGGDAGAKTGADLTRIVQTVAQSYGSWPETQRFLREVEESVLSEERGSNGARADFAVVAKIVEAVADRFGKEQDGECRAMARSLIAREDRGSGRLKLADFYQAGWQFKETKEYLLRLGAAETVKGASGAEETYVIIPNYVNSVTNCIASSSMYSVCCIDACEDILRHLELRLGAPTAAPEDILPLVSALPSATVTAPRELAPSVVGKLKEAAQANGGRVPLHGRLFAMWLHHAYPRECPFPSKSGTTKPTTADDWLRESNTSTTVTDQEIAALIEATRARAEAVQAKDLVDGSLEDTLPWDADEELVYHHPKPTVLHELKVVFRAAAMVGAMYGLMLTLAKTAASSSLALAKTAGGVRLGKEVEGIL